MVGQASGAIKVSLMFIIFLKSLNDAMMTGLAFFIMAVAMICVCLWGCIVLFNQPIVKYYIRASERDDEYRYERVQINGMLEHARTRFLAGWNCA